MSQIASAFGVPVNQLRLWREIALGNWPHAFEPQGQAMEKMRSEYENTIEELYAQVGRLTTELTWLKKKVANSAREDRMALLDKPNSALSLKRQAELLSLNRSGLYYRAAPPSLEEVALKHRIDQIYTECPFYGSRRIAAVLHQERRSIDYRTVRRHLREMGIPGICPGPNLSKRDRPHRIYPDRLRGITFKCPDHVWGIDITYVRLHHGWMYLVAIRDWYSRFVVSYELDQTLDIGFVLQAVKRALGDRQPEILNSDQGRNT